LFTSMHRNIIPNGNWGFYLNCGSGNPQDENLKCGVNPAEYAKIVIETIKYKPSFVGACCGSNPNHIKEIKRIYAED